MIDLAPRRHRFPQTPQEIGRRNYAMSPSAKRGSAQMRGVATGVGSKADIGTLALAQL